MRHVDGCHGSVLRPVRSRPRRRNTGLSTDPWHPAIFAFCLLPFALLSCSAPRVDRSAETARFQKETQERLAALQIDSSKPLTLADCEAIAVKNNLAYRVQLLQVQLQDERVRLAMSDWLPKAQADFNQSRQNVPPLVSIGGGKPVEMQDQGFKAFNLHAMTSIFDFGATYLAWQTAKDRRAQEQLATVRTRQTLLRDVRVAYARYAAAVRQEKLSQSAVEAALEILRVAKSLEREGLNSPADSAFVESALAQAGLQLALVRSSIAELRLRLNETLSLPNGTPYAIEPALPELPPALKPEEIPDLEAHALRLRPEVFAQDLQQHIAADTVRKEIVGFLPHVDGALDFNWSTLSNQVNPTFYTLGFSVAQSLLDGSRVFRLREAKKNVSVQREQALLVATGVLYDVDLRALQCLRTRNVLFASDVLVNSQATLLKEVQNRFREGIESGANAAKALADLRGAELEQDHARTEYLTSWYELRAAALTDEEPAAAAEPVEKKEQVE
jgi:outer membrane protein TolC